MSAIDTRRRVGSTVEVNGLKQYAETEKLDENGTPPELGNLSRFCYDPKGRKNTGESRQMEKVIGEIEPEALNRRDVRALQSEERELIASIRPKLVPRKLTNMVPIVGGVQNPEFRRTVNRVAEREMSASTQRLIDRLKTVRRLLRPTDPEAGNIEDIRPE